MKSLFGLTLFMLAASLALTGVAYVKEPRLCWEGWKQGSETLLKILPMLFFALALSGLVQVMVPKEFIAQWLGNKSGWRGIWLGCVAGAFTPGGPVTSFPVVAALHQSGAGIGTLVAYITAWSLWAVARLPMEIALISPRFALVRLACTFFVPPLAGAMAHVFFRRYFSG